MKSTEVEKLLIKNGWKPIRQLGSHKMFKKTDNEKTIALPMHKRDLPIGTLNSILKQAGIK